MHGTASAYFGTCHCKPSLRCSLKKQFQPFKPPVLSIVFPALSEVDTHTILTQETRINVHTDRGTPSRLTLLWRQQRREEMSKFITSHPSGCVPSCFFPLCRVCVKRVNITRSFPDVVMSVGNCLFGQDRSRTYYIVRSSGAFPPFTWRCTHPPHPEPFSTLDISKRLHTDAHLSPWRRLLAGTIRGNTAVAVPGITSDKKNK